MHYHLKIAHLNFYRAVKGKIIMDNINAELKELILHLNSKLTDKQMADLLGSHTYTFNKLVKKAGLPKSLYIRDSIDEIQFDAFDGKGMLFGKLNIDELISRLTALSKLIDDSEYRFELIIRKEID